MEVSRVEDRELRMEDGRSKIADQMTHKAKGRRENLAAKNAKDI
jgi:hypothetical protein